MIVLFGTNALLFGLFQVIKSTAGKPSDDTRKDKKEKELSKPFLGTMDCFYKLTIELFRTSLVLALTYICEKHWIFEHSGKDYSRDLFMFVLIIFFAYGFYTWKPITDLSLLSREQTEEWKGWMQFIFLLYHYFHAEEVYNSVRVMITCYVWMTGFGNFSFFYMKQDFGWLRVVQMLWRLNFSVLLLMWTHGNTWILYYICPMHTFYFLMVYVTMFLYSSTNHSKWGIRLKLMVVGVIIYIIWDINGGIFDFIFAWLGTDSVVGANRGSVWEYYFRTSLDHWSSFLGMIFALNFPLAEQYFVKAKGWPLVFAALAMGAVTIWWFFQHYMQDKMAYNLTHSYFAIIPLISYIFFRNITPTVRSGVSMSMHDLGKTTLETYLLQHHIWLTSNAKTLLTIVPGHPWINFALATILFFTVSKELYRLTMSLRGMIMPDDKAVTWTNSIGMGLVVAVSFGCAFALHSLNASLLTMGLVCVGLFLGALFLINRTARQTADNFQYQLWSSRASTAGAVVLIVGVLAVSVLPTAPGGPGQVAIIAPVFAGMLPECQRAISEGNWLNTKCPEVPSPALNKAAMCDSTKWTWASTSCPVGMLSTAKSRTIFKGKKIAFIGDSELRGAYHQFNNMIDPSYKQNTTIQQKHFNLENKFPSSVVANTSVAFLWAPFVNNVTTVLQGTSRGMEGGAFDLIVIGAACWDALYVRDLSAYSNALAAMANALPAKKTVVVWLQPTTIIDGRLGTAEKQQHMTEAIVATYRNAFLQSAAAVRVAELGAVVDTTSASLSRETGSVDGIHYSEEVYRVIAQMAGNAYSLRFPAFYAASKPGGVKKLPPKVTGSMSFPGYGAFVLILSAIMLVTMDSFLGIGYLSLRLFGRSLDWEAAYGPLLKKLLGRRDADGSGGAGGRGASANVTGGGQDEVDALLGGHGQDGSGAGASAAAHPHPSNDRASTLIGLGETHGTTHSV